METACHGSERSARRGAMNMMALHYGESDPARSRVSSPEERLGVLGLLLRPLVSPGNRAGRSVDATHSLLGPLVSLHGVDGAVIAPAWSLRRLSANRLGGRTG